MVELHPSFLEKNGKAEFVVLPMEEYESLQAYLEDLEDSLDLRKAKIEDADDPTYSLEEAKKLLELE